jgi:hypothetical protein
VRIARNSRVASPSRRGALRIADVGVLVVVGLVVLLVSLPRLRDFALRENETDAANLVTRIGRLCDGSVQAAERSNLHDLLAKDPQLGKRLDDAEYLDGGRVLRRHGYLFTLLPGTSARVLAWPWEHSRTGHAAFAWSGEQHLVGNPNVDGAYSGMNAPARVDANDPQWRTFDLR